jgi:TonB-linked SusC/RagA family outer membrane protein
MKKKQLQQTSIIMKKPIPDDFRSSLRRQACSYRFTAYLVLSIALLNPFSSMGWAATVFPKDIEGSGITKTVELTVSGRVVSEKEEPMPGVNIVLKGTTIGTVTDQDGRYAVSIPDNQTSPVLVFSFIGYSTIEETVNGRTSINVTMAPDMRTLNEVVVIGYQEVKRSDIMGAVGVVDADEMKRMQVSSLGEMLQGRASGVTVTSSGAPGQTSSVKIRGTNSLLGQDAPLYVIDGMFINGPFPDFNPNDIESVQVLKDAAATALYGSRGMNGVIVITTKRGKVGAPKVDYNTYVGWQNVPKKLPLMNAEQYRVVNAIAYQNNAEPAQNLNQGVDTDWQDELFRTGSIKEHNLTLSGANDNANYLISANYFDQKGAIVGPSFKRYQLRVNSDIKRGRVTIGQSMMLSHNLTTRTNGLPFIDVLRMLPTIPVRDPNTRSGFGHGDVNNNTFGTNPIGLQEHYSNTGTTNKIFGSLYGELQIFSFLKYKLNLGLDYSQHRNKYFERIGRIRQNNPDGGPAYVDDNWMEFFNLLAENTLNFNKDFGKHSISALAGFTTQKDNFNRIYAHTEGINGEFWVQDNGTSSPRTGGSQTIGGLRSLLGSFNYDFDDKYFFQFNVRRDGSSKFGNENQYATFPSASVAWRIKKESFMQGLDALTDLKLRASYGTVGNQAIPDYATQAVINYNLNYVLNGSVAPGAANRRLVNENLRWESKTTTNFGLDLGLLENRVMLTAEYFVSKTKDLLIEVPIPMTAGNNGPNPYDNLAAIQNKGLELALTYQNEVRDFNYSATANFTSIRNKVLDLIPANGNLPLYGFRQVPRTAIGTAVADYYVLVTDGIFQTQQEVDSYVSPSTGLPIMPGAQPGDIRFVDSDGDGDIDFDDRQVVGSPFPKFEYGINLSASWKGFDASIFFNGVAGNLIFNEGRWWTGRYDDNGNYRTDDNFWTEANSSNTVPRPRHADPTRNPVYNSDRWIEKGDYFRLKNVQIGYSFPQELMGKTRLLTSLRLYATGQNLLTFTKYTGYDPEVTGFLGNSGFFGRGMDIGNFPVLRSMSIGLQAGF